MTDQKRRGTLRMLFLVVCVLPTSVVLISVFGSGLLADTNAAFSGKRRDAAVWNLERSIGLPRNIGNYSRDETTKWLDEIGIRSGNLGVSKSILASISVPLSLQDLNVDHPLQLLSISELKVRRSDGHTTFSAVDCVLSREELLDFANSFFAGRWGSILKEKSVTVEFERVVLTEESDASSRRLYLSDVQLKFDSKNPTFGSITGRQRDSVAIDSAEKPFHASFSKSASQFSFNCTANRLPIWVFGNAISKLTGDIALFRGSYQLDYDPSKSNVLSLFVGEFDSVSAATLSAGALTGPAIVKAKECRFVDGRLDAFEGAVFSSSSGTINKKVFQQNSDQFVVASGNDVDFYRSFGCDIELENGLLKIRSPNGYQNQIVWGATQNANASSPIVSAIQSVVGAFDSDLSSRQPTQSNVTFRVVDVRPTGAVIDISDYLDRIFLGE